jgi:hypothetical protein
MKPYILCVAVVIFAVQGCSGEAAKRTAFETLQNMHEQQCERDLSGNCPERDSYDGYRRKRQEARSSE